MPKCDAITMHSCQLAIATEVLAVNNCRAVSIATKLLDDVRFDSYSVITACFHAALQMVVFKA